VKTAEEPPIFGDLVASPVFRIRQSVAFLRLETGRPTGTISTRNYVGDFFS